MRHLLRYIQSQLDLEADKIVVEAQSAKQLGKHLLAHFDIKKEGKDIIGQTKVRYGQSYFRRMVLANYQNICCVTGLNVPAVLRASHIVAWSDDKANRMNPENGLCLSATYDAAFDQHLISFDENYKMVLSKAIRDYFTNAIAREYFEKFENKSLLMPTQFAPSQTFLEKHRERLVG